MQTNLAEFVKRKPGHDELESILRACVHCGFCNATCPTYQLLGNELDSPRGRIYLLKQMLEGEPVTRITQQHLDRCLSCRSCETTCPSGVRYGRLLDLGRVMLDERVGRAAGQKILRGLIKAVLPYRTRFDALLHGVRLIKPVLPQTLKNKIPDREKVPGWPAAIHARKMLIMPGCVQQALAPSIDAATAGVLDKLGISLIQVKAAGCCGALDYHLSDHEKALAFARKNIDACWPYIEQGAEAIIMTASGCGVMVKDYGELLRHDHDYAEKAMRFSALVKDVSVVLMSEDLSQFKGDGRKVAFQSPCTLQHGQKITGTVEAILEKVGYRLTAVADAHLCCGSAGVYSLLEPALSRQLLHNKLQALQANEPDLIVTANIGCLNHLQSDRSVKVLHWIELLLC
ncbi:glycolate oxidase subunit GlcF [Methylobacter sp. YRD-M1]|uniref:glycolate oxidase subunit GlcF n=1 Tax=Methylobacter sp. YRD-M1 TaxID=2911520 RepID=UPI00227AA20F|nr:glycolate oxidase subunit GlcF [Methylobacter sp. YRD-M1]WAK00640.1 glycolate oxidase subunit GlcF [Methylobacter sp. YRD-M1]